MSLTTKYSAKVNEQFEIKADDIQKIDVISDQDNQFHLLLDNRAYRAELLEHDLRTKTYVFRIEGETYKVVLSDDYDRLVDQMGLKAGLTTQANDIKAPMPGLVLEIKVEEGQDVSEGEPLLILEAMKMENVIKAPADVTIKSIQCEKGQAVEKGALLIDFA